MTYGGSDPGSPRCNRPTIAPVLGRRALVFSGPPRPTAPGCYPVKAIVPATPWSFDSWCIARKSANLLARRARPGNSSQTRIPGTVRGDWLERPAILDRGVGLHVERIEVARPAP